MPEPSADVAATALFVELVVIGSGAAGVLALVLAACIGWGWVEKVARAGPLVIILVALVYVLGIIVDRIADAVGEPISSRWRAREYDPGTDSRRSYEADLFTIMQITPLASRLAYGRSRLRVCRGWLINCVLGAAAFLVYVLVRPELDHRLAVALSVEAAILLVALGCLFSWRRLATAQYAQVRRQAQLREATGDR